MTSITNMAFQKNLFSEFANPDGLNTTEQQSGNSQDTDGMIYIGTEDFNPQGFSTHHSYIDNETQSSTSNQKNINDRGSQTEEVKEVWEDYKSDEDTSITSSTADETNYPTHQSETNYFENSMGNQTTGQLRRQHKHDNPEEFFSMVPPHPASGQFFPRSGYLNWLESERSNIHNDSIHSAVNGKHGFDFSPNYPTTITGALNSLPVDSTSKPIDTNLSIKKDAQLPNKKKNVSKPEGKKSGPPSSKRALHSIVEKKYRTNINDRLTELKQTVPTIRFTYKSISNIPLTEDDHRQLNGMEPAKKLNKATILHKATEYIRFLEQENSALKIQNAQLQNIINYSVNAPMAHMYPRPSDRGNSRR
ncbi:putative transcription factor HMS1 [Nakaseomyces bracarensis]|uniref:Transcription factor HMS1 n=1 Tax=Nakaseomyces bracarensis TaxID=273131 RepID=A0ABR4NPU3_9SACH